MASGRWTWASARERPLYPSGEPFMGVLQRVENPEVAARRERRRMADAVAKRVVALLEEQRRSEPARPGPRKTDVSKAVRQKVARLRIERATNAEIMRQTGLSKTVVTRLVGDVDEMLGQLRAGRY